MPPPAAWLQGKETIGVLTALAGLPAGFRQLAFRLLRARCGPEPWDLRDEAPNRSFLAMFEQIGCVTKPWLDGIGAREVTVGSQRLLLELEKDPLQIMRMGEPFETCLAPGSINFFSAVSNAADVNKRVLYAKDVNGVIHGRCLLALTDAGHLLAFNVYASAHHAAIEKAVRTYVLDLATAMRTGVAAEGQVRELISTRWYDDGAIDLTGQLDFLRPPSKFLKALETLAVSELVPALEHSIGGGPITPSILSALSATKEFQIRPELAVPLLPYVGESTVLGSAARLVLAANLRRAGKTTAALRLLEPLTRSSWHSIPVAGELIELGQPHRALRLIRQSRPARVAWDNEWSDNDWSVGAIVVAATALAKLCRPRQALELYRIASRAGSKWAGVRAAELERELCLSAASRGA